MGSELIGGDTYNGVNKSGNTVNIFSSENCQKMAFYQLNLLTPPVIAELSMSTVLLDF